MKLTRFRYPVLQICAAIISLSAAAVAQEQSADVAPQKATAEADQKAKARKQAARRATAKKAAAEKAAAEKAAAEKTAIEAETAAAEKTAIEAETAAPEIDVLAQNEPEVTREASAPKKAEFEPSGPFGGPPSGPPGGPPGGPGGPPPDGPPPMAVGELKVALLSRVDVAINSPKFDDPYSSALIGFGAVTKAHEYFSLATNLAGSYDARDSSGTVYLLDAIIQFEPIPEFNVWFGRMVEPVDRSSLSGPWFTAPWYMMGIGYIDFQLPLPQAGFLGRSNGVTAWGGLFDGHLKYYAAALDLATPGQSPMFAGRLNLSLFTPEREYYNFSSYLGADILAIGVGGQSKKNGSVNPITAARDDYAEVNADLLFEKNLGPAGVFGVEGAYYKFFGDNERTSSSWFGLASYILPWQLLGLRIQPLVRVQQATPGAAPPGAPAAPDSTLIDAQVSFMLKGHFAKFALGYRRAYAGDIDANSLFFGLQFMQM